MNRPLVAVSAVVAAFALASCNSAAGADDQEEVAQSAGDAMASLDEAGQGSALALFTPGMERRHLFQRPWQETLHSWVLPEASAAACTTLSFTQCASGVRSLNFAACTLGSLTVDGSMTLTFSNGLSCLLQSNGDSITRTADFTITGRRSASIHVTSEGGGEKLTRTSTGFTYRVLGMRRVATASESTLFDVSTETTADIGVTGNARAGRKVDGGTLVITHNVKTYTVSLTPADVTWTAGCNCPTSGTLTGNIAGSVTGTAVVTFNGCGTANLVWNGSSQSVSLDRCAGI